MKYVLTRIAQGMIGTVVGIFLFMLLMSCIWGSCSKAYGSELEWSIADRQQAKNWVYSLLGDEVPVEYRIANLRAQYEWWRHKKGKDARQARYVIARAYEHFLDRQRFPGQPKLWSPLGPTLAFLVSKDPYGCAPDNVVCIDPSEVDGYFEFIATHMADYLQGEHE